MNISFNDTLSVPKRRIRSVIMTLAACALSILNIFIEKIYAPAEQTASSYDSFSLYFITFAASAVLLSCALTMLSYENKHSIWVVSLISALIVTVSYVALEASPADTLLALAFIPSAIVMSVCISRECEKAHTVVANAVVVGLTFLFSLLLSHYSVFGEISARSITYTADLLRESLIAFYSQYNYSSLGVTVSQLNAAFETVILVIPSLFCAFAAIVSYIEVSISRSVILGQGVNFQKLAHWPLKMSRLASFVFLATFITVMLSVSAENGTVMISAINLMLVLLPGFFLVGIRAALLHVRRPGFFGMIFGIFILISCIQNPAMLFILVSVVGAIDNLFATFRTRLYGETKKER